jgi:site-specific recombinase XerD
LQLGAVAKSKNTIKFYEEVATGFAQWLEDPGHSGLLDVTRHDASAWLGDLRDRGLVPNTARNRWVVLRSLFGWLVDEEEIDRSPLDRLTVPKPETPPPAVLSTDEIGLLFKACAGRDFKARRDYAILRLMAGTGLRIAEVAAIDGGDLDLANRFLVVRHGKGDRVRVVRLDAETAAALDRYQRVRARHRLANLKPYWLGHRGPFGTKGIRVMVNQRAEAAGIGHVTPHQLRHSWAHLFLSRGGNEGDLQVLGG